MKPFRWNIKKREQLGDLLAEPAAEAYDAYPAELAECAAKVVARSANKRIVFVGRSPENIFDYLSGVFEGTSHASKLDVLNISNRFAAIEEIQRENPGAFAALRAHFHDLEVSAGQIVANKTGVCFCDLVAEGGTFAQIFRFFELQAREDNIDLRALVQKLGFLGITVRMKTSPNTWRWQQHADWVRAYPRLFVKNISAPDSLWTYLGNRQVKVAKTNPPARWGSAEILHPPREAGNLSALRQAYDLYRLGSTQRKEFVELLAATPEFKDPWLRKLASELKGLS
ncbi:MAG: hypothetical protein NXI24_11890 [bacterium]|nr:hypothetical protein [bacterium]